VDKHGSSRRRRQSDDPISGAHNPTHSHSHSDEPEWTARRRLNHGKNESHNHAEYHGEARLEWALRKVGNMPIKVIDIGQEIYYFTLKTLFRNTSSSKNADEFY